MKLNLHQNGWTGIVEDLDFANITQEQVNELGRFLATNTLIVVRGQNHLTVEDETRVAHMFGNVESMACVADQEPWNHLIVPGSNNEVLRVTGELDEHGQPGLFGHVSDLDWHCNKPAVSTRMPLVWLLGIKGTVGSRTSWNNNIWSYRDLDQETKDIIKDLKMVCGWKKGTYSDFSFSDKEEDFNEHYTPNLVHINEGGQTGLFFPFLQFRNFVGMSIEDSKSLTEKLRDHILQEKYIYHHDWNDGDIVIAEQWLGIHKRWRFEGMPNRVLHRSTFDFANIDLSDLKTV
jgi:alpha-ketoglutarate-dependent taurine dioxygenase